MKSAEWHVAARFKSQEIGRQAAVFLDSGGTAFAQPLRKPVPPVARDELVRSKE
jgi:hypothetical protein